MTIKILKKTSSVSGKFNLITLAVDSVYSKDFTTPLFMDNQPMEINYIVNIFKHKTTLAFLQATPVPYKWTSFL
jgi:hypothetical protein